MALSGAGSLRSFYTSGVIMHRPDEDRPERMLHFELRNGPGIKPMIVHPLTGIRREGPTTMSQCPSPLAKSAPHPAPVISTSAGGAILALDLGTTTGWASLTSGVVHSGTASFRSGSYDGRPVTPMNFLSVRCPYDTGIGTGDQPCP